MESSSKKLETERVQITGWRYEFHTFGPNTVSDGFMQTKMDELGRQGWEAFSTVGGKDTFTVFFKRPHLEWGHGLPPANTWEDGIPPWEKDH